MTSLERAGLPAARADVPVDPDAETAREWAEAELADPIYREAPSLLDRLWQWLREQLQAAGEAVSGLDPRVVALVVVALALLVGAIAYLVAGPVGRARRARASVDVFGDDTRTAAELRAAADAAAAAERWSEAVLERFRAILRSLEDRVLLDPRPGRTAAEGAAEAGARLPAGAADLRRAARLFDDVCYGHQDATRDDDVMLRALDARIAAETPLPAAEARAAAPTDLTVAAAPAADAPRAPVEAGRP